MAASLMTRCLTKTARSYFTHISRSSLAWLSTKPTDGGDDASTVENKGSEPSSQPGSGERGLAGFAKALEKARMEVAIEDDTTDRADVQETEYSTFAAMLRHSKIMQMGDFSGRMVVGTIIEVVGDDLYIDLGGKFHCVCSRPKLNSDRYHRGVKVKLQLNDFEMTSSFLGSETHVTLLEADATLIGLRRQPAASKSW